MSICEQGGLCEHPIVCERYCVCRRTDKRQAELKQEQDAHYMELSKRAAEREAITRDMEQQGEWKRSARICDLQGVITEHDIGGKPTVSVASSILTEAANIVGGDRNSTHGDKERSFQVIANLWNAYLSGRKTQGDITPFDVAQFMVLLKVARSIQGKPVRDHFTDAAGYSAIAGELVA